MFDENENTEKADSEITFEEQEFYNWCDANDIDRAVDGMDEEDLKSFEKFKHRFAAAVREKRLVVDGDKLVYTVSERSPTKGRELIISPPNGRAMLAMDGYKETQQQQKLQAFMAAISGVEKRNIADIATLNKKDYLFLQDVATHFLTE
jgi:hypothetical protein